MHYRRARRYGDPLKVSCACGCGTLVGVDAAWSGLFYIDGHGVRANVADPADRLKRNQARRPVSDRGKNLYGLTDDCLIWTGRQSANGYGLVNVRVSKRAFRSELAHRLAYELAFGEGSATHLTIDHLCGVPLCCNPNHLEAVSIGENLRRAARAIEACPRGHIYDEKNTLIASTSGHRYCRQCNRNRDHLKRHGHDFVLDETNPSAKRQRCLVCRLAKESTPQFCPYGHEYTPENRIVRSGKRACRQCIRDRTHVPQFGHSFVPDPANPSNKRERCLVCVQAAARSSHPRLHDH